MEHIAAFMLLVGCGGDVAVCKEIPVPLPAYESISECQSDLPIQMRMAGSADSRLFGACKEVSEELFEQSATVDWAISRSGELMVEFNAEPQLVAAR